MQTNPATPAFHIPTIPASRKVPHASGPLDVGIVVADDETYTIKVYKDKKGDTTVHVGSETGKTVVGADLPDGGKFEMTSTTSGIDKVRPAPKK